MPYKDPSPEQVERQRESRRKHYEQNREQYYARNALKKAQLTKELRRRKEGPCADCGQRFHFAAMDFDHRPGEEKTCNPSKLIQRGSWSLMESELGKCDLVCANCHRVRTYERLASEQSREPAGDGVTPNATAGT